jgi:hypothetical protein
MQMTTTPTFNVRSSTAGHSAHRHEASSRVSRSGVALLSNNGSTNRVLNTAEDARACDVNFSRRCLSHNQGIVDKRYKAIHRRLYEKVQQRNIQRHIDHLDELMQKLLDTQDPDNKLYKMYSPENQKLYELYAERKRQYEALL